MAAPTNERRLVDAITRAISANWPAAWILKTHGNPYQTAGLPDLLVVVAGHLFGLEVKHQKSAETEEHARGRATALQLAQLSKLATAGAIVAVVISVDEVLTLIHRVTGMRVDE